MKKRLLAMTLSLCMVLVIALAGCTNTTGGTTTTAGATTLKTAITTTAAATTAGATTTAAAATTTAAAPATWDNLSWEKDTSPVTFTAYIDYDWYGVDHWGDDDVSQEITKLTGVSLEVTKASDTTQLNVLLAAGSLSDITFCDNLPQRFESPDIAYRWDELIQQYCPEMWDLVDPLEKINNQAADGHVYTFKTHYKDERDYADDNAVGNFGNFAMAYRSDVMNKLGLKLFTSVEELDTTFYAVKEKASEVGITMIFNLHPAWGSSIAYWMGIKQSKYWDATAKSIKMQWNDQLWLDYYKLINKWYRDGILVSDCLGVRPEDFFSRNQSGQVFCYNYNWGVPSDVNGPWRTAGTGGKFDDLTKPVFELVYPALTYKGENNLDKTMVDYGTGWSSCFIAKTCKNPGRAICYMEFLKSPQGDKLTQWGIEGKHYTLTENGQVKRTEEFLNYTADHKTGIGPWYFQGSDWAEGVGSASSVVNCTDNWALHDETIKVANRLQHKKSAAKNKNPVMNFARVESTDAEMAINTKLADEWNKRTAEMVTADSEASVEQIWTDLQTYMTTNGLAQLEAKMTENYVKNLARYQTAGYFTDIVTK